MFKYHPLFLFFLFSLFISCAKRRDVVIQGKVINVLNDQPLSDITISFEEVKDKFSIPIPGESYGSKTTNSAIAKTNLLGNFSFFEDVKKNDSKFDYIISIKGNPEEKYAYSYDNYPFETTYELNPENSSIGKSELIFNVMPLCPIKITFNNSTPVLDQDSATIVLFNKFGQLMTNQVGGTNYYAANSMGYHYYPATDTIFITKNIINNGVQQTIIDTLFNEVPFKKHEINVDF